MNFLFPLLGIILFAHQLQAQSPFQSSVGDSLRKEGDLPGALVEYRNQYKKDPEDGGNLYNFACALSLSRETDSAFKYLNLALQLDTTVNALLDPDFVNLRKTPGWMAFEQKVIACVETKNHFKYPDLAYSQKLWRMGALDQAYYYELELIEKKFDMKSPVYWALWELKDRINEENQKELEQLIEEKGWPLKTQVYGRAANVAFLVIQHSSTEKQKSIYPQ